MTHLFSFSTLPLWTLVDPQTGQITFIGRENQLEKSNNLLARWYDCADASISMHQADERDANGKVECVIQTFHQGQAPTNATREDVCLSFDCRFDAAGWRIDQALLSLFRSLAVNHWCSISMDIRGIPLPIDLFSFNNSDCSIFHREPYRRQLIVNKRTSLNAFHTWFSRLVCSCILNAADYILRVLEIVRFKS